MEVFSFLLLAGALLHLFLFINNRFLLNLTDSRWKPRVIGFAFLVLFLIPVLLVLGFRANEAVASSLQWRPEGGFSRLFFILGAAAIVFWGARSLLWGLDRFLPDLPPQVIEESSDPVPIPPVFSSLPRGLRTLDTTGDLHLTRRDIVVSGLAPAFDGLTIAQVSDVHFGQRLHMSNYLEGVQALVEGLNADIVVLTGDFVDHRRHIQRSIEYHSGFRGRLGSFAVLGNHDYWTRPEAILSELSRTHIRWLGGGERRVLKKNSRRLIFAGTDSPWDGQVPDWRRLLRRGTGDAVVLLSHTPDNAPRAGRNGVSLVLSGHNHGGQVCLPFIGPVVVPSAYGVRFAGGAHRAGPDTVVNVSRGVGVSTSGIRILCPPEICLLTLRVQVVDVMAGRVIDARSLIRSTTQAPEGGMLANRLLDISAPLGREGPPGGIT